MPTPHTSDMAVINHLNTMGVTHVEYDASAVDNQHTSTVEEPKKAAQMLVDKAPETYHFWITEPVDDEAMELRDLWLLKSREIAIMSDDIYWYVAAKLSRADYIWTEFAYSLLDHQHSKPPTDSEDTTDGCHPTAHDAPRLRLQSTDVERLDDYCQGNSETTPTYEELQEAIQATITALQNPCQGACDQPIRLSDYLPPGLGNFSDTDPDDQQEDEAECPSLKEDSDDEWPGFPTSDASAHPINQVMMSQLKTTLPLMLKRF